MQHVGLCFPFALGVTLQLEALEIETSRNAIAPDGVNNALSIFIKEESIASSKNGKM